MKRGFIPPIDSLIAFESAARHGSFTRAAEELFLTQGAVSKQVRLLEGRLGVELFKRVRQRIVLTDAGRLYLHDIRGTLEKMTTATRQVMSFGGSEDVLNLAVLPTFGTRWLAGRLPRFHERYPEASFNLSVRLRPFDFEAEPFDGAIHYGEPVWARAICEPLFPEDVVPVCSRSFRDRYGLRKPEDLCTVMRLHQSTRPDAWQRWFMEAGVETDLAFQGPRFDQFTMISQAAAAGLGVALVPKFFITEELKSGALVTLFDTTLKLSSAYHFVYPENRTLRPVVKTFKAWLQEEAKDQKDREELLPG
ncbi:LysR substrate-binding domain-containing protein [Pseudovibrio sp. SPO723]|uniref:LysR substrate-binding domain-containing protein n=1 Tax=Nesiotobacter zosterae TaxID=392721 RepID=UPI0029C24251|nr:LysR substrate-binding domain-containing protein [Pseudovibrio sp. SPO723]MDX5595050.1 LysR substrate-binding domain-containing protein [Pseudovibrio sp. SPO723]